jgi:integrase/recombinase XerD
MRLQDLDWSKQTLHLPHTKARRGRLLPLPADAAKAIADYLRQGRPRTGLPVLFVRHQAPWCVTRGRDMVTKAMKRAFARCGLEGVRVHILRHTVATRLQQRGVNIKAIADLLGHQSLDTTAHYARVNLNQLRRAALPWPEGWR